MANVSLLFLQGMKFFIHWLASDINKFIYKVLGINRIDVLILTVRVENIVRISLVHIKTKLSGAEDNLNSPNFAGLVSFANF